MITIGIGAYKEKMIKRTIDAIMNQGLEESFEVIVACPDDETALIVRSLMKTNKKLKLIKEQKREGQPAAYNKIIKKAKGRVIVFTDGDTYFAKDAIKNLVKAYDNKKVGAAGGRPLPINERNNKFGFWAHYLFEMGHKMRENQVKTGNFYYISGPICSIRRGVIDEMPKNALATDAVLGLTVLNKGWKVVYVPEAVVYQKAPTNLNDYFKQKRRTMAGFYQMKKWFPKIASRSFGSEASQGFAAGLKYAKNFKETIWFFELVFYRIIAWALAFYDMRIAKKGMDLWVPIESTK